MSGQGHQIFVDVLARGVSRLPGLADTAREVAAPLRVGVRGRRGVGRRTVARALAAGGLTVTAQDLEVPEVDVYVVAEVLKPEDRDALAGADRPTVIVVNKADLAGFGPGGPLLRAGRHAEQLSGLTGMPARPLVALLADLNADLLTELLAALRVLVAHPVDLRSPDAFLASSHPLPRPQRERLVETLDVFGIAHAVVALRRAPGAGAEALGAVLREVSGVDAVLQAIDRAGAEARYRRMSAVCDDLDVRAITDESIAEFLSDDETVLARMAAAVDVVEAAGLRVDPADESGAHLNRARRWRDYAAGPVSALHRRCGTDIVRGSMRLLDTAARGAPR